MKQRDRALVGGLVAALALVAVLVVAAPQAAPLPVGATGTSVPSAGSSADATTGSSLATYHEGIVGRWASVTPLTARTNADRELVALVFSGLVRLGADGGVQPDLARSWTVDKSGGTYTFEIAPGAVWQDGVPVTAADVAFTFRVLQDPDYAGPMANSWQEVRVDVLDDRHVRFHLGTPLGGFLQAATQPLLPEHLLRDVAPADLATSAYARLPIGSGPFRLVSLDSLTAHLERAAPGPSSGGSSSTGDSGPASSSGPAGSAGAAVVPGPSSGGSPSGAPASGADASAACAAVPTGSPAGASSSGTSGGSTAGAGGPDASPGAGGPAVPSGGGAAASPGGPSASSGGLACAPLSSAAAGLAASAPIEAIDLHFYDDAAALSVAYRAGQLDGAVGLTPAQAAALAALPGSRLESYPTSTLTAVLMNQRGQSVFRNAAVRSALMMLVDRDSLVKGVLLGQGDRADGLVPPGSWAFDAKATGKTPYDRTKAAALLTRLGWRKVGGSWAAAGHSSPLRLAMIAPARETNPITFATASRIAKGLAAFGLKVTLQGLTPGEFAKRLQAGSYSLALVDMNLGLDPDLYPLLASTQATTTGANISGVQSLVLDDLLGAARKPGSLAARKKAYAALEAFLAKVDIVVPVYYRDQPVVLSDRVQGPVVRQIGWVGDRYWDVLTWRLAGAR